MKSTTIAARDARAARTIAAKRAAAALHQIVVDFYDPEWCTRTKRRVFAAGTEPKDENENTVATVSGVINPTRDYVNGA